MSTPPSIPDPTTALEVEKLRGELRVGLVEIKGSLALLVQRSDQTDRTLVLHEQRAEALERRVDALETSVGAAAAADDRGRWVISAGGAIIGTLGGWIIAVFVR